MPDEAQCEIDKKDEATLDSAQADIERGLPWLKTKSPGLKEAIDMHEKLQFLTTLVGIAIGELTGFEIKQKGMKMAEEKIPLTGESEIEIPDAPVNLDESKIPPAKTVYDYPPEVPKPGKDEAV